MTAITVSIARDPALVRTVRLVAAAVARRSGQDEELVEEIRLAIGEACALMVGVDAATDESPIDVTMSIGQRLRVDVSSEGELAFEDAADVEDGVQPWALLRGLIEDFQVTRQRTRTTLSMSWPLV